MGIFEKELRTISFKEETKLDTRDGFIKANVAAWLSLDDAGLLQRGRLYLKYFSGMGYKTIELDEIKQPTRAQALLSAQASIPAELKNLQFTVCVDVDGTEFRVDTLFIEPVKLRTPRKRRKSMYAA